MPFTLQDVVPWGRNFEEYVQMFALSEADLSGRVLGCGDGPASFNAEATRRGGLVISCDPLYAFTAAEISQRIDETYDVVMAQTRANKDQFVWRAFPTPDALGAARMNAMRLFLADYDRGKAEGRYVTGELPHLPFDDGAFDLALCSHFLWLYSDQFDLAFHTAAMLELCRVAREVRVFPLRTLANLPSPHLDIVIETLHSQGYEAERLTVGYEFQRGGNQMLRVVPRV